MKQIFHPFLPLNILSGRDSEVKQNSFHMESSNYYPVMWLTANEELFYAPTQEQEVYEMDGISNPVLRRFGTGELLETACGSDWKRWYICEESISLSNVTLIEIHQPDGNDAPIE